MLSHRVRQILIAGCLLVGSGVVCSAEEAITVSARLRDGRVVVGDATVQTDDDHLWLRSSDQGIELQSGFAWSKISDLMRHGKAITIEELLADVARLPKAELADEPVRSAPAEIRSPRPPMPLPTRQRSVTKPIRSLQVQCALANWDADANVDGLLVTVWPLNEELQLEPVSGMLDLVLRTEHEGIMFPSHNPRLLPELARISLRVSERDFTNGPAVYRLPFAHHDPEADPSISRYGIVSARLGISGQGVFEATDSFVRLRNPSALRDRLQHATGQRYFSFERPGR